MTPKLGDRIRVDWPGGWAHEREFTVRSLELIEHPGLKPYWCVEVMERFAPDGGNRRHNHARDQGKPNEVRFLFPVEWCRPVRSPGIRDDRRPLKPDDDWMQK